mmetsp:Transcript_74078/g.123739  ORF Transcript_74078/g.123739 Transcript_74078/m.123739 type:complete len:396 (+) Transcript_74078:132-1319(+)
MNPDEWEQVCNSLEFNDARMWRGPLLQQHACRLKPSRVSKADLAAAARNLVLPVDACYWTTEQLTTYTESEGNNVPVAYELPVRDDALVEVLRTAGLSHLEEPLHGAAICACATLISQSPPKFQQWAEQRGVGYESLAALQDAVSGWAAVHWQRPPLVVCADAGLCNKLRVVLSHALVARESGRPLLVVWEPAEWCPGRFSDVFEAIDDVFFVDLTVPLHPHYEGCDVPAAIKHTARELEGYRLLVPIDAIRQAVAANVAECGGPGRFVAVHIRRTDHKCKEQTSDQEFFSFVDKCDLPLYCAADCKKTQELVLQRYGMRLRALHAINNETALRHTSLQDAVVDLFTCVYARRFKGSFYSSFSDTICFLRQHYETSNEADEHQIKTPTYLDLLSS